MDGISKEAFEIVDGNHEKEFFYYSGFESTFPKAVKLKEGLYNGEYFRTGLYVDLTWNIKEAKDLVTIYEKFETVTKSIDKDVYVVDLHSGIDHDEISGISEGYVYLEVNEK